MNDLRFSLWEMLSLIGVVQCVYILVYIIFRVANIKQSILPVLYFFVLCCAFFLDFGNNYISALSPYYNFMIWAAWATIVPLSVLLIVQVAQISRLPSLWIWSVLFFIPLSIIVSSIMVNLNDNKECGFTSMCSDLREWMQITSTISGAASLLILWGQRGLFNGLLSQKAGKERYWLSLSLIMVNIGFLSLTIAAEQLEIAQNQIGLARTILGLVFIYLVTTSLFRIYPQALALLQPSKKDIEFTKEEQLLADKIHNLITLDKIYHEPTYSRADLARELSVSEASVSRIINLRYGKSLPQLLNEQRVADAKRLLLETDANIKIVAQEVGFNSIPSFNRVFKDLEGQSPTDYRRNAIK